MLDKLILFPYYLTLKVRHWMYDKGFIYKTHPCEVPTVSIGNVTAGGTGKTPHTEMVLGTLLESNDWAYRNVAVLSRGHKRRSRGFQQVTRNGSARFFGDEPLQIKKNFPVVTVAVDKNRVEGCDFLLHPDKLRTSRRGRACKDKELPPSDLIVLDDAFQYRALRTYFNIVLVDYNRPVFKDRLLPLGHLRDLPERIEVADVIIVTKCPAYLEDWEKTSLAKALGIKNYSPSTCTGENRKGRTQTVLFTAIHYRELKPVYGDGDARYIYSQKLILFSGIAKDTPMRRFLSDKYKIVKRYSFPDHHKYNAMDIRKIAAAARENPTAVVVTTEKDSQRLLDYKKMPDWLRKRLFMIPIAVDFLSDREKAVFNSTLLSSLRSFSKDY
ncbi:MAG: tetraacyldisaccharide 4'-kinase [Bacteroidales bacterium]|nr:tetraacyldisaccharide 4'-kinase [Bacteroidales bacterium]